VGYDAGKKVKRRKIHALVDSEGLPMRCPFGCDPGQDTPPLPMARTDMLGGERLD